MSLRIIIGLSFAALFSLFSGCERTGPSTKNGELKLAVVANAASSFWTIVRKGCDAGALEAGHVSLDFRIPSSGSAAEQQQLLDDLIARGVDGIAVTPVNPINQVDVLNRVATQTLLITQDSDAPGTNRISYIGTDNRAAGREAGNLLKEAIPNGGEVMIFVGTLDAQNARDRYEGLVEAVQGSNIRILDVRTDETDRVRAKSNVLDTLVKYPNISGLVGLWSYNGPAMLGAVREADKVGQVKIVSFDEEEETLAGVASGEIYGTVVQQPYEFGREAVVRMASYLRGNKLAFPADGNLIIPTQCVRKDNVGEFQKKLQAMLAK